METILKAVLLTIFGFAFVLAISLLFCFPIKWTWNYVMPYLFDLKEINVWHAFCLSFLAGVLIKPSFASSKD